jgi:hypothetical protein
LKNQRRRIGWAEERGGIDKYLLLLFYIIIIYYINIIYNYNIRFTFLFCGFGEYRKP